MKNLFLIIISLCCLIISSCSSNPGIPINENTAEGKALKTVKKQLKRHGVLVSYEIINGQLPIELNSDNFKKYRDAVYKASLDYRSCKVRNLKAGMEKAINTIETCQVEVKDKVEAMVQTNDKTDYLIVLATAKEKGNLHGNSSYIAVFNPETMNMEKWITITTPIQNNAILISNAMSDHLMQYGMEMNQNLDSLANTVNNPIVKFILKSNPK